MERKKRENKENWSERKGNEKNEEEEKHVCGNLK